MAADSNDVHRREFDTDTADPNVMVASTVAELEGTDTGNLPPLYACIDHMLERLFDDPPASEAEAELSFTYGGYRITVVQDGSATFRHLE